MSRLAAMVAAVLAASTITTGGQGLNRPPSGDSFSIAALTSTIHEELRVADFAAALSDARALHTLAPDAADAVALYGDALWAGGLFDEAEDAYRQAIDREPTLARARYGVARSLASRSDLRPALDAVLT